MAALAKPVAASAKRCGLCHLVTDSRAYDSFRATLYVNLLWLCAHLPTTLLCQTELHAMPLVLRPPTTQFLTDSRARARRT